ncbi:hypothetical protein P168DRAFT_323258 [Aspergillus campestris IBT 28561]|uniref:Uncharacterized protein n=1 Tax=Aspergillus campestris (strain IBT 28561) TaxID=1392248 RepID=A0A2I1DDW1_ASPC2|nr:uncharacterized protein P168DRAFT_323258 [Aspergillus campestris IBT 28561]PKY08068.1 hypothetical protein P168DRAFT_323258 [Aspergillus campestris IBT 28561]
MSHPLVAAVWEQLGRRDLANILREIIGQHAVDIAVLQAQDDQASKIEPLTRSVFWIKTIFDAQRTRLQELVTTHDVPTSNHSPYLLPSDAIFSTLMYLVQVKSKLFPCNKPVAPGLMCYRHFIAHTLLAGIRLLVLRGDDISAEDKFNLERAMAAAWQHPDLTSAELFLINDLLPRAGGKNPPIIPGLERLDGNPETLITDLLTALIRSKTATLAPFCWLYDILCSAESALIQCHINWRHTSQLEGPSSPAADTIDDTLDQARNTRTKLVRTVLAAFDDEFEVPSLQILSTVILTQNADGHPPLQTRRIRDNWARLAPMREFWEASLGHLIRWLINRRVQMWDSNGELDANNHDYQAHLAEWLQASPLPGASPLAETRADSVYTVDCPAGHAVPREFLDERVRSSDPCAYEV